jgi:serine/threonine-protein kinase RsbW
MTIEAIRYSEASLKDLAEIRRYVRDASLRLGGIDDAISEVVLAVNEAVTNVMIHGYREQAGHLEIAVCQSGEDLIVYIRDESPSFDPNSVPEPDIARPLERRHPGGMGIHMMRNFVDEMIYSPSQNGVNELAMVKRGVVRATSA